MMDHMHRYPKATLFGMDQINENGETIISNNSTLPKLVCFEL